MNRIEEAKEVFAAIYEVPMESPEVLSNVRDIQLSLELAHNVSLANLVKMGKLRSISVFQCFIMPSDHIAFLTVSTGV